MLASSPSSDPSHSRGRLLDAPPGLPNRVSVMSSQTITTISRVLWLRVMGGGAQSWTQVLLQGVLSVCTSLRLMPRLYSVILVLVLTMVLTMCLVLGGFTRTATEERKGGWHCGGAVPRHYLVHDQVADPALQWATITETLGPYYIMSVKVTAPGAPPAVLLQRSARGQGPPAEYADHERIRWTFTRVPLELELCACGYVTIMLCRDDQNQRLSTL